LVKIRIKEYFKLEEFETDFVNISLDKDLKVFIDPNKINNTSNKDFNGELAKIKIEDFFLHNFNLYKSGKESQTLRNFESSSEINATHLGYSNSNSNGKGNSPIILKDVFDTIKDSGALTDSMISNPVILNIFVPNFGEDRLSDLITSIISKELAEYTLIRAKLYNLDLKYFTLCDFWNDKKSQWEKLKVKLPFDALGKPILLVPKSIVSLQFEFSSENYLREIIYKHRQQHHLDKMTPLVQVIKRADGSNMYKKPTQKMLKQVEIDNVYGSKNNGIKKYILDQTLTEPQLLQQYLDRFDTLKSLRSFSIVTDEDIDKIL